MGGSEEDRMHLFDQRIPGFLIRFLLALLLQSPAILAVFVVHLPLGREFF